MSLLAQIRCTVLGDTFCARAIERQLQRVRLAGGRTAPVRIAAFTLSSSSGFRPRPGASCNPARPCLQKRWRHRRTVCRFTPSCWATTRSGSPPAHSSTMRARNTVRCSELFLPTTCSNAFRSDSLRMTSLWAGLIPRQPYHIVSLMYRHLRDTTLEGAQDEAVAFACMVAMLFSYGALVVQAQA